MFLKSFLTNNEHLYEFKMLHLIEKIRIQFKHNILYLTTAKVTFYAKQIYPKFTTNSISYGTFTIGLTER